MRHTYLIITGLSLLVFGCKSKPEFIPGLEFGQTESEWKATMNNLLDNGTFKLWTESADTMCQYRWQLEDTAVTVNVSFNYDGIKQGPLRTFSFNLCTYAKDIPANEQGTLMKHLGTTKLYLCPKSSFIKIKEHLDNRYGKPDSTSQSQWGDATFYYKEPRFDIILEQGTNYPSSSADSDSGTLLQSTMLHVLAKNYRQQVDSLSAEVRKALRPKDVVELSFYPPQVTKAKNDNGGVYPALQIIPKVEWATSIYENRAIESIKGDLQVTDRFGEVFFEQVGFEYTPLEPLKPQQTRLSERPQGWYVFLVNRPEVKKLRDAVVQQKELKVEFKPTAVYYSDGSVLR